MEGTDHSQLLARLADGDDAAFTPLYRTYLPLVLRWSLSHTGDRELAADLSAEVFAAALLSCRRYRPEAGSVGAWLLGIAHNKLRESRRRRRIEDSARRKLGLEPYELTDADLERVDELVGMEDRIAELVADLPAEQRTAVIERVVNERSYEEIAADLSCSESVVRQRVSRGLRTLRSELEGQ
jgi:RNA polymerase sigma-70 factor (ECF subfamily)